MKQNSAVIFLWYIHFCHLFNKEQELSVIWTSVFNLQNQLLQLLIRAIVKYCSFFFLSNTCTCKYDPNINNIFYIIQMYYFYAYEISQFRYAAMYRSVCIKQYSLCLYMQDQTLKAYCLRFCWKFLPVHK